MFCRRKLLLFLVFGLGPMAALSLSASTLFTCEQSCSIDRRIQDAAAITTLNPDWVVMRSQGLSMKPFIQDGDLIVVQRSGYDAVGKGMMVVFIDHEGDQVVHSILEKSEEGFVIGGLNNAAVDPARVDRGNFVGVVIGILRVGPNCPSVAEGEESLPVALCKVR